MNCEFESRCLNNKICFRCYNHSRLKVKCDSKRTVREKKVSYKDSVKDNSWETLEQEMVDKLNNPVPIQQARRSRGSGNVWFEKGDVLDSIVTMECKERTGTLLKSGERSMSIKREWLEKAKDEAMLNGKTMALPFRFKGDEQSYIIMESNSIIELINTLKAYQHDNDAKTREMELLKEKLKR